ncbi:MAG: glycosyltransferase family 4 protein [Gemmatimonadota bacterium]
MKAGIAVALVAAPVSWALVGMIRGYLVRQNILDLPSHRSSHSVPTPRGGGLGAVLVVLAGVGLATLLQWLPSHVIPVLLGGGAAVAIIGWIDDRGGVSPIVRLMVHLASAIWAVSWLGSFEVLRLGSTSQAMGAFATLVSILVVTWAISSYNFMDGLDALAASEAVYVGVIGGVFSLLGGQSGIAFLAFLIAAASLGFLIWNLPPAKVFMGDVASGFLGYAFVVLALASDRTNGLPAVGWLTLLGVFVFDSTVTLLRRILRGENWRTTHRESGYQRAALRLGRHGPVTVVVLLADLVLTGLCWFGWRNPGSWGFVVGAATGLLILLYYLVERFAPVEKTGTTPT